MKTYTGTFAKAQPLGRYFVQFEAENYEQARRRMLDTYGTRWAFLYESVEAAGVNVFGLTEVAFGTPNDDRGSSL